MKTIKLFTMVKDEVDIVEDWLLYHGTIFGFCNLHIIDNYSSDGTYEILLKYKKKGIFLIREKEYKHKGLFMRHLIKDRIKQDYDLAYPLDIDEFIIYYDKDTNKIRIDNIKIYLSNLPKEYTNYKTNYILSQIDTKDGIGYNRACVEAKYGDYINYGNLAKTFFNNRIWNGKIDHGNHYCNNKYFLTNLCLIHFHSRNLNQMKKKSYNNVKGLGYNPDSLDDLNTHLNDPGKHHVKNQIDILQNKFHINTNYVPNENSIDLSVFNNYIKLLRP